MLYREYGKTGKKVSVIGFGGMRFAAIDDREACVRMMVEAANGGINYFDTAPMYFGTRSEEVFGEGFRELARRNLPFYCATKTMKSTAKEIRKEIDAQLKRLGRKTIDFYHVWCIATLDEWKKRKRNGVLASFRSLKEEGLVRHICVSNHLIGDEIKTLLMEDIFEGVLFGYSAYNFNSRGKAFETIASRDLGCVVMNPLGGGIIPQNPALFDFIRTRPDETVVEAALRFLLSHERITCALVGFSTLNEVKEALRAVEGFAPVPAAAIARMKKKLGAAFADLCTGCQYCDNCPEGIPIPRLMEAYNHKKLYGTDKALLERLSWHWDLKPEEAGKCTGCGQCEKLCTQHLPIVERMADIASRGKAKR
jgi:predicted aldo/keto reductase-like oxidoreductase